MAVPAEGYTKFHAAYDGSAAIDWNVLDELNAWRARLRAGGLVGAYADGELAGVGYGNLSVRTPDGFVITATGTGGIARLGAEHYVEVVSFDLKRNRVRYCGASEEVWPSAECMTHGAFYEADGGVGAVIHVHEQAFWERLLDRVPTTLPEAEYGTPEMGHEIHRLYVGSDLAERRICAMGGHPEGVIAIGRDLDEAGRILMDSYEEG